MINTTIQPTTSYRYNNSPQFCSRSGIAADKTLRNVEFAGRVVINKITEFLDKKEILILHQAIGNADKKSPNYISQLTKVCKYLSPRSNFYINLEDKRIEEIAASGKPHIFIMNHDHQSKDPKMLCAFNSFLNMEYLRTNQASSCPRPRIVLNEDILLAKNKTDREIFDGIGAVPIDAGIIGSNKKANAKQFIGMLRDFIKGEANIFIFPEGRNSAKKYATLEDKFQLGVAEMVQKLADKMPEVYVTPIGFAYGGPFKGKADSIYIGKTITFKKSGKSVSATCGNADSSHADEWYKNFFKDKESAVLTENGVPVEGKGLANYIGGILCENMRICKEEAKDKRPLKKDKNILLIG